MVQTLRLRRANAAFVPLIHPVLLILLPNELAHALDLLFCRDVLVVGFFCIPRESQQVGRFADTAFVCIEVWHDAHDVVCHPAYSAPCCSVAVGIAANKAAGLPELDIVQELAARKSCLAHDELIGIAGG